MTRGGSSRLHGRGGRGRDVSQQQLQDEHDRDTRRYPQRSIHRLFNTPPHVEQHGSVPMEEPSANPSPHVPDSVGSIGSTHTRAPNQPAPEPTVEIDKVSIILEMNK